MIERSKAAQQAAELGELLKIYAHAVESRDLAQAVQPAVIAGTGFFVGTFAGAKQAPTPFAVDATLFLQAIQAVVDKLELELQDRGIEVGTLPEAQASFTEASHD